MTQKIITTKIFVTFFALLVFLSYGYLAIAQSSEEIDKKLERELQEELAQVEKEIKEQSALLQVKRGQSASISRDIDILTVEVNQAKLKIRAKEIEIRRLGDNIVEKQGTIGTLEERILRNKDSLSELMRKTRDIDSSTVVEVLLASGSVSGLFSDLDSFYAIEEALHQSFNDVRDTKSQTEKEKTGLEIQQREEIDARAEIEAQKRIVEAKEDQKQILLRASRNQERAYETILADRERARAQILNALFRLRGTDAITFGEAFEYSSDLEPKTGVRPAFLMAILTQESNLGANVGTCNRPGDSESKHWSNIMKPSRDIDPFLAIVSSLGISPEGLPLSCPAPGGWGGAMGPSQFIPSTWTLYINRLKSVLSITAPNPWNPEHAFTASSLFLADLGAARGGFSSEREAALRYYAGGNWSKPQNAFYGNGVMSIAAGYQTQIDRLQNL